jgi:DNA primase
MITRETIAKIHEAARIEEVVSDFVSLKKRGANLIGLCPFHNEKTPSFHVSVSRGIYKCFGCGKAGNPVNFIMEHEHLSFPEALRYLAGKYGIEVEEDRPETPEEQIIRETEEKERESLMVACSFAQKFFTHSLHETDEGKSVGRGYFESRGFTPEIIQKFQLGYSPEQRDAFSQNALASGFNPKVLEKAGLIIVPGDQNQESPEGQEGDNGGNQRKTFFDRYSGRVIFPIHNLTGRVIAFAGRTLRSDKKTAKYINSPETPVYYKSKVLYGMNFAKSSIAREDECFLVEGYTDVMSMHQAGIENVVASSGTSLTQDQVRLIRRYSKNITILYDGDAAGIKASFRGINLILEEGMNVRVLLFPEGDDPDSFSKKNSPEAVREFIEGNKKDFITFKTGILSGEAGKDPIKKAELIKDIVESIALIPDLITRTVYVKECSRLLDVGEQTLLTELNKIRKKSYDDKINRQENSDFPNIPVKPSQDDIIPLTTSQENQEKELLRMLLSYSAKSIVFEITDPEGNPASGEIGVPEYIYHEISQDEIEFEVPVHKKIFSEIEKMLQEGVVPDANYFTRHPDPEISGLTINLLSSPYELSEWERHGILVKTEELELKKNLEYVILTLRLKKLEKMKGDLEARLKEIPPDTETDDLLVQLKNIESAKTYIAQVLGRVVLK